MIDEIPVTPGAYAWWYLDAVSDDGRDALVVIFFVGSVFSPYYARRLRAGESAHPSQHAAVHVARYRDGRRVSWLLIERDAGVGFGDRNGGLSIGRSSWRRVDASRFAVTIDERGPGAMKGTIDLFVEPDGPSPEPIVLAPGVADHTWCPVAPRVRVHAEFASEGFILDGDGYHDRNFGSEPLERTLSGWDWARVHDASGARSLYDVRAHDGRRFVHIVDSAGHRRIAHGERDVSRAATGWRIQVPRDFASHPAGDAFGRDWKTRVIESTPFYARFALGHPGGARGLGETLDLRRFDHPVVRWMLRWKTHRHRDRVAAAL